MRISPFQTEDMESLVAMAASLWPGSSRADCERMIADPRKAIFVGKDGAGACTGFVAASIRQDYVEGSTTSPVGYIEGVYVESSRRRQGAGRMLVEAAERWIRSMDCTELGSDVELPNTVSQQFHARIGFQEANRLVSYIKPLDRAEPPPAG